MTPTEDRRGAYRILVGRPEGKRKLGRPRRGWEGNIKKGIQAEGRSRWRALVNAVSIKCREFLD